MASGADEFLAAFLTHRPTRLRRAATRHMLGHMNDAERLPASAPTTWRRLVRGGAISAAAVGVIMISSLLLSSGAGAGQLGRVVRNGIGLATDGIYLPAWMHLAGSGPRIDFEEGEIVGLFALIGAFWFMVGAVVTAVTRRRWHAIAVWLGIYLVCDVVSFVLWGRMQP